MGGLGDAIAVLEGFAGLAAEAGALVAEPSCGAVGAVVEDEIDEIDEDSVAGVPEGYGERFCGSVVIPHYRPDADSIPVRNGRPIDWKYGEEGGSENRVQNEHRQKNRRIQPSATERAQARW